MQENLTRSRDPCSPCWARSKTRLPLRPHPVLSMTKLAPPPQLKADLGKRTIYTAVLFNGSEKAMPASTLEEV
ncbi:MAG: hypothetical protein FD188_3357 [Ignavibacteria bacterium]|nr:MAG: hypothetical protein FD188_3357 [Ignavibacteria bacterium]